MESMREVDRAMEREIAKGSCPIRLDRIEFGDYSYREIASREKLLEVLSYLLRTGTYSQYAGKTVINNVYMNIKGRKPVFKRARSFIDRNSIYTAIQRYGKKLNPEYDGKTYLETVRCFFNLPEDEKEKYRVTYDGRETFAFPMSDKYILGLYTHCISARQTASADDIIYSGLSEKEMDIVRLENVRDVLFQCLLLDDMKHQDDLLYADLCTIYCLKNSM